MFVALQVRDLQGAGALREEALQHPRQQAALLFAGHVPEHRVRLAGARLAISEPAKPFGRIVEFGFHLLNQVHMFDIVIYI